MERSGVGTILAERLSPNQWARRRRQGTLGSPAPGRTLSPLAAPPHPRRLGQARREVIGQILDYTKELASWNYEDLQREVSRALGRKGNVPYELVRAQTPGVDEAEFVKNVSRHLRRGEFLLLIIGDGIREGVENIVQFVQSHSGLHFNLALVEAALYRDTAGRIIVQPRVLTRTEVVRRVVVEGDLVEDLAAEDAQGDEAPSGHERENVRFWTAVLDDYAFADVTVEVPEVTKAPQLYVKVRRSGWGDWGLSFVGYLDRSYSVVGCYLTCRKGIQPAAEVYEDVGRSLEELRIELGDNLERGSSARTARAAVPAGRRAVAAGSFCAGRPESYGGRARPWRCCRSGRSPAARSALQDLLPPAGAQGRAGRGTASGQPGWRVVAALSS